MIRTGTVEPKPNGIAARALAARGSAGLPISAIRMDGGTQSRALLQDDVIAEYAAAMSDGVTFPPIVVFYDGSTHWLADGFHRVRAAIQSGASEVPADVRQGTQRDAILYSVGANEAHGLRRTNDDKRRAVLTLLNDAEWAKWSDREIARQCAVSDRFVNSQRALTANVRSERTYTTKHGTVATMNTSAIGRTAPEPMEPDMEVQEETGPVKRRGTGMTLPEGENIIDLCRRGLELEADGLASDKVAAEIGITAQAYRYSRQIVLLADDKSLSPRDAEAAKAALELLISTGQWGKAWELVEDLAARMWGDGRKEGLLNIAGKRLEQFDRTLGIVMQACVTTDEIELPYLSADRVKQALRQIGAARGALSRFADRIKEIHE